MKRSGHADLPLHYGHVPAWLYTRMAKMGRAIVETIVLEYGKHEVLTRLSDPFWFQSFGAVLGMDWHSSGITTSVMGALKKAINPLSHELGIYVCGGKGKLSRETPNEIIEYSGKTGINRGNELANNSKLTAKIDNTAVQDGFNLYLHNFILTNDGEWVVIQQGMNDYNSMARRYHWHSKQVKSFINEPHTAVCGINQGQILNLTHSNANNTRKAILNVSQERPDKLINEVRKLIMPGNHAVMEKDVDLKRLGAIVAVAYESNIKEFENLLMIKGLGPKTLRSLTLVSEVIHGTPSRFDDPARFSFAHGGKDGHPYPVQTHVYDKSIQILNNSINKAKLDHTDKVKALKKLHNITINIEKQFKPNANFNSYIEKEKRESKYYGGRTVFDKRNKKLNKKDTGNIQLRLFD